MFALPLYTILSDHQESSNHWGAIYIFATWFPLCYCFLSSAKTQWFPLYKKGSSGSFPVVRILHLYCGGWVQFLVGELRSCKLCIKAKMKWKKEEINELGCYPAGFLFWLTAHNQQNFKGILLWLELCLHPHIWMLGGPWGLNETSSPGISILFLGGLKNKLRKRLEGWSFISFTVYSQPLHSIWDIYWMSDSIHLR